MLMRLGWFRSRVTPPPAPGGSQGSPADPNCTTHRRSLLRTATLRWSQSGGFFASACWAEARTAADAIRATAIPPANHLLWRTELLLAAPRRGSSASDGAHYRQPSHEQHEECVRISTEPPVIARCSACSE